MGVFWQVISVVMGQKLVYVLVNTQGVGLRGVGGVREAATSTHQSKSIKCCIKIVLLVFTLHY